jgi:paraquat-inducible protein A
VISPALTRITVNMARGTEDNQTQALADRSAGQFTTALLILSSCLLPLGLLAPALETTHLAFWSEQHSILSFGIALLTGEEYLLAALVLGFSIAFPSIKLVWMWRLQFTRSIQPSRTRLRALEMLGKWSMADVLIIALIVFSLKDGALFGASPLPGVYVFAASTVLAMLASGRIVAQIEDRLLIKIRNEPPA